MNTFMIKNTMEPLYKQLGPVKILFSSTDFIHVGTPILGAIYRRRVSSKREVSL